MAVLVAICVKENQQILFLHKLAIRANIPIIDAALTLTEIKQFPPLCKDHGTVITV